LPGLISESIDRFAPCFYFKGADYLAAAIAYEFAMFSKDRVFHTTTKVSKQDNLFVREPGSAEKGGDCRRKPITPDGCADVKEVITIEVKFFGRNLGDRPEKNINHSTDISQES